jgi:hypothetical protein
MSDTKVVLFCAPRGSSSPFPLAVLDDEVTVVNVARTAIRTAQQRARRVARPERAEAMANTDSLGLMIRIAVPGA